MPKRNDHVTKIEVVDHIANSCEGYEDSLGYYWEVFTDDGKLMVRVTHEELFVEQIFKLVPREVK